MKGDITRSTFNKKKHYSSVRMQQGRVQMDGDWNEQMDIQTHLRETQTKDVIGLTGYPKYNGGFAISVVDKELKISHGRMYVDGILCELEEDITYTTQPDYPIPPENVGDPLKDFNPGIYLVYLDVWQRHITALEDEYIREKALGGPDTATRTKTICQVKLQDAGHAGSCSGIEPGWQQDAVKSTGTLQARSESSAPPEPCILPSTAGYRRLENQLYRVEIHKRGIEGMHDAPTFKWSRDNGCITAKVKSISGSLIEISHPVPGRLDEFAPGQWIEVTDDVHELHGEPGILVKITNVKGNEITVDPSTAAGTLTMEKFPLEHNPKIRLWNSVGQIKVKIPTTNDGYLKLENGVEIKFEDNKAYETGDYWLIPARTATGDVEWPEDTSNNPLLEPAHGIVHHYCKLALVKIGVLDRKKEFTKFIEDCRPSFPPLNEIQIGKGCCTITVGDGITSFGDTDDLDQAIDKVRQGGQICLLPGVHRANLTIKGCKNITITGCGMNTYIIPEDSSQSICTVAESQYITIENINFVALRGTATALTGSNLNHIEIKNNRLISYHHAVRVEGGTGIQIIDNEIGMVDMEGGDVAVSMKAEESVIAHNDIRVIPPAKQQHSPIVYSDGTPVPYPNDPKLNLREIHELLNFRGYVHWLWELRLSQTDYKTFKTRGGIQIASGSVGIRVIENQITWGLWNGITLGDLPGSLDDLNEYALAKSGLNNIKGELSYLLNEFNPHLENIKIDGNEIMNMGGNGIGVRCFFKLKEIQLLYTFRELTICRNTIINCLQQIPPEPGKYTKAVMGYGGVALADCENLVIRENRIENNGNHIFQPVSGIFILQGEDIDISDNRIFNNGPCPTEGDNNYMHGARGGIVIAFSFLREVQAISGDMQVFDKTNVSITKIHDNIVKHPLGQALFIIAFGPVSIVGNHLMSQGIDVQACKLSNVAGAVLVLNFGVSKDLLGVQMLPSALKDIGNTSFSYAGSIKKAGTPGNANGTTDTFFPTTPTIISNEKIWELLERCFLYLPSGNILFSNNQTTLKLHTRKIDRILGSQLILTLDDISYSSNQSECASILDVVVADSFVYGITTRVNDNRFQEGITGTLFSLLSFGLMNNTTANQSTNCIQVLGPPNLKVETGNKIVYGPLCGFIYKLLQNYFARAWIPVEEYRQVEETSVNLGIKRIDEKRRYVYNTKIVSKCELYEWLDLSFNQLEKTKMESLEKLNSLQQIKNTALKKEYKNLSGALGEEHPKVKALKARLDYNANMFKELDEMVVRVKTQKPEIDNKTWIVKGMTIDKNRKGVTGLTVAFYDEKGERLKNLGTDLTDEHGYFSIAYSPKDVKKGYDESTEIYVKVISRDRKVVFQSEEPMFIKPGTIVSLDIDLPDEKEIITPPEQEKQKSMIKLEQKIAEEKQWVVEGLVKDNKNNPIKAIQVRLYDTEHLFDQRLGSKVTDKNGKFKFTIKGEDVQALMKTKADIHLEVVDEQGKIVYTSPEPVRCEPGHVEVFDIQISPPVLKRKKKED